MPSWSVVPAAPDSPEALALWRAYYTEVSDRWFLLHEGRTTPPDELARELVAADDGSELLPPKGELLVARWGGAPAGTAGLRMLDVTTGELTRVFLARGFRGRGGARVLLDAIEGAARALGAARLVLDTRADLVEARALYARHGYVETPPGRPKRYADHWFEKVL
ncbi:GNAT family N-acetyltransferase [Streptomyces sp. NPDC060194]|uniref:GNAT family N-acetyltransferase n=1 Tax=Streptomyces sp. NPDC060194 TaxID=3347069 RepID=UPI0036489120